VAGLATAAMALLINGGVVGCVALVRVPDEPYPS
jgi:hypothetical protein